MQIEKIKKIKEDRNNEKVTELLGKLETAARGSANVMPCILAAVEEYATLGEISDVLRKVFGEYK